MAQLLNQLRLDFGPYALLTVEQIYASDDAAFISSLPEDRRIERKPATIHPEVLGNIYFPMWANTPDGGLLVLGVEDDGRISGCHGLSPAQLNALERAGIVYCSDARFVSKRLPAVASDGAQSFILLIRVFYREDKLVTNQRGEAYGRVGGSKRKLTREEMREIEADKGQPGFEMEPCGSPYPGDFDRKAIADFATKAKATQRWDDRHSAEEVLELLHLGRIRGGSFVPNVACYLLFAIDPSEKFHGCRVRFLRFEGQREGVGEKFNAIKDVYVSGTVPVIIAKTADLLDGQLREFSRLGPDGKFTTAKEYPPGAWYEAVVNACVHRSYGLRNMDIFVKMFDDRLVIESPGGFPPLVTPDNIYTMHHPRNPKLMGAMKHLDYVKCAHEGTRRMLETMTAQALPAPEFSQTESHFASVRVTLRNDIEHRKVWIDSDAGKIIGEALFAELTEDEKRAVNCAAENDGIVSVSQMQRLTHRTWPSAKKLLIGLVDKGILDHRVRTHLRLDPQARFRLKGFPRHPSRS